MDRPKMTYKLGRLFNKFQLGSIKLTVPGVELEVAFDPVDQDAAWELYIEMLTRVVTQPLPTEAGDEQAALKSVYELFGITREILRRKGRATEQFSKVAIPVLNQVVRPFTAKWHRESLAGEFDDESKKRLFRGELEELQGKLRNYNRMLASIADVEDLTDLEQTTRN